MTGVHPRAVATAAMRRRPASRASLLPATCGTTSIARRSPARQAAACCAGRGKVPRRAGRLKTVSKHRDDDQPFALRLRAPSLRRAARLPHAGAAAVPVQTGANGMRSAKASKVRSLPTKPRSAGSSTCAHVQACCGSCSAGIGSYRPASTCTEWTGTNGGTGGNVPRCSNRGLRCVRIARQGRLAQPRTGAQNSWDLAPAPRRCIALPGPDDDGGSGAVLILLKPRR